MYCHGRKLAIVMEHAVFQVCFGEVLLLLNAGYKEAANINIFVFGLIQAGIEPTIFCNRGEHIAPSMPLNNFRILM
jgi:hypothetical protein